MLKPDLYRGVLGAVLAGALAASCSSGSSQADPFYGTVFATDGTNPAQLDTKFLPQVCGTGRASTLCRSSATKFACPTSAPCYPAQQGFANGSPVYFYNLVSMSSGIVPVENCSSTATFTCPGDGSLDIAKEFPLTAAIALNIPLSNVEPGLLGGGGAHVDVFPHSCTPGAPFNAEGDIYATAAQFPIFNNLPFPVTLNESLDGAFVFPFVATYGVTLSDTETCNDLKDSRSIADASNPGGGAYGATRSATPTSYQLWAPIDISSAVLPIPNALNPNYKPQYAWYEGLLLRYLDGGPIPTANQLYPDGKTRPSLVAMEGVIVDPASGFSDPTDPKVIVLPAQPGDDAYSPIVHLHDYKIQSGQSIGSVTSICQASDPHPCPASSADFTKATAAPFYTIFIASTPQQTN